MTFAKYLETNDITSDLFMKLTVTFLNCKNEIPGILKDCKCCERHRVNFPRKFEKWIETDVTDRAWSIGGGPGELCMCPCRHLTRMICRQIEDNTEGESEGESEGEEYDTLGSDDTYSDENSEDSCGSFISHDSMPIGTRKHLDKIKKKLGARLGKK
jgi:hypothetical protein